MMRSRKRSLLGSLLLPAVLCTPFQQHRLPPAARHVEYSRHRKQADEPIHLLPVPGWRYVHSDASRVHPDAAFDEIRNKRQRSSVQDDKSRGISSLKTRSNRGTKQRELDDAFVDGTENEPDDISPLVEPESHNDTTVTTTEFNVSVHTTNNTEVFTSNEGTNATSNETSTEALFRPIRMRAFLSENSGGGQFLVEEQRSQLMEQIIRPALLAWSAALRVQPVSHPLTVDRMQLKDGKSCGPGSDLPGIEVPEDHFVAGVNDTDVILYISLAFTNAVAPAQEVKSVDFSDPNFNFTGMEIRKTCAGDYLAASAFCSTDQNDRPTAALMHLCIGEDFFYPANVETNVMLVMHELGHALGFNAISLAHFRRWDGTPLTERDSTGAIPLTEINCTGPEGQLQTATVPLPSEAILQFRTVRNGVRVAEVVTPAVRQAARNHFDCQELPGAELESGEFLPLSINSSVISCIGDHWERRLFKNDLMNPIVDENLMFDPRFSTITLAYFADSGWYQVDLSRASLAAGWGRAAGCAFVEEACIRDERVPPEYNAFFCDRVPDENSSTYASEIHGCTPDLTRKAQCALGSYDGELPTSYQYFSNANVGGNDPFMDYCPVYAGFTNGLCSDTESEAYVRVDMIERFGAPNSRCLSGQVTTSSLLAQPPFAFGGAATNNSDTKQTALCLPIACVVDDKSLHIQVEGTWELCKQKGQIIVPRSVREGATRDVNGVVSVVCPDPIRTCPTFYCVRDCLGTDRICDYSVGQCVCGNSTGLPSNASNAGPCDVESDDTPNTTSRPPSSFFKPDDEDDNGVPQPDDPLSTIYVQSQRYLKEEKSKLWGKPSKIVIPLFACCCAALALFWYRIRRRSLAPRGASLGGGSDGGGSPEPSVDPQKHKMIASLVVDMRMNDPNLGHSDVLWNRDSETDHSMTDTEVTSEAPCSRELKFPGTIADLSQHLEIPSQLDAEHNNDHIDPLAPPAVSPRRVVRRRHNLV